MHYLHLIKKVGEQDKFNGVVIMYVSISDISRMYNKSRYDIWNWYNRDINFPKPEQYINNKKTPIFEKDKIEKYMDVKLKLVKN